MKCNLRTVAFFILTLSFFSCSKNGTTNDPTDPIENTAVTGKLYFSGCQGLYCFDLNSGNFDWAASVNAGDEGTPVYENGILYISDPYGCYAFDAQTGKNKWRQKYSVLNGFYHGDFGASRIPVIADTTIYTMGFDGPSFNVLLYAINKKNGNILWSKLLTDWGSTSIAQLRLINKKLILLTDKNIMAVNCESGEQVWQKDLITQNIVPVINMQESGSLLYVFNNSENKIVTIEPNNGNVIARIPVPSDFDAMTFAVQDNYIYGTTKANLNATPITGSYYVIDKTTGTVVNTQKLSPDKGYNISFNNKLNENFFYDIHIDSSSFFLYNPFYLLSFSKNTFAQQWKEKLPLAKMIDSLGVPISYDTLDIIQSGPVVITGTYTAQISSFRRIISLNSVNDIYMNVDIVDKKTGVLRKSFPFRYHDCYGVPYHYMVVDDGKAYYTKFDR